MHRLTLLLADLLAKNGKEVKLKMQLETLANAIEDTRLRDSLKGQMSAEEVSAFEEYIDEYESADYVLKKDN
jgi:glycerol-3-phosphate dehydrogenase